MWVILPPLTRLTLNHLLFIQVEETNHCSPTNTASQYSVCDYTGGVMDFQRPKAAPDSIVKKSHKLINAST
ncbi:hypothetical protein D3C81_2319260 [compost metagenome]